MYDYECKHVGKDLFRRKKHEEDILGRSIVGSQKDVDIPVGLKAYGDGYLQLSTDKNQTFFPFLKKWGTDVSTQRDIDEKKSRCNIMVFDFEKALPNDAAYSVYR